MRNTKRNKAEEKFINIYSKKTKISAILWLLSGFAVLGFGLYFWEYFEIVSGIVSIGIAIVKFTNKITSSKRSRIMQFENNSLHIYMILVVFFSLVNPCGLVAVIFDIYRRDWCLRNGAI
ncbi:MAG: hypothetical protein Q4B36_03470 [Tissierellia bacterium]|nr:hypothetical protein [Tissierellia bacterium]